MSDRPKTEHSPGAAGWLILSVLSATAGAADVIGFLGLGGLFTAHITGNLVVVAIHFVTGRFSEVGPLIAVPMFVIFMAAVTLVSGPAEQASPGLRRRLLALEAVLLAACLILGVAFGPFADPERPMAVLVGMLAVAAMAAQNAMGRLVMKGAPSTAVMTMNITQLTIDLVTIARPPKDPLELANSRRRTKLTFPCLIGFILGCVFGALLEIHFALWAFALPVALSVLATLLGEFRALSEKL